MVKYEFFPRSSCLGCPTCKAVSLDPKSLPLGVVQRTRPRAGWDLLEGRRAPGAPHPTYPIRLAALGLGPVPRRTCRVFFTESGGIAGLLWPQNIKTLGGLELVRAFLKG